MTHQTIDADHLAGLVIQELSHKSDSDLLDMLADSDDIRELITGHPAEELGMCMRDLHSLWGTALDICDGAVGASLSPEEFAQVADLVTDHFRFVLCLE